MLLGQENVKNMYYKNLHRGQCGLSKSKVDLMLSVIN